MKDRNRAIPSDRITALRDRVSRYALSFVPSDGAPSSRRDLEVNISLKIRHTHEVWKNIAVIAAGESLGEEGNLLAEAIALMHDVGRFPQYARYRTFDDRRCVNHGELGAEVVAEQGLIAEFTPRERKIITDCIRFHNAFAIPKSVTPETAFFLKLVRDADKLDIWRVFIDYYEGRGPEGASAAGLGLPLKPGYSEEALSSVLEGKVLHISRVTRLNDYKLVQLAWVYDLNFRTSYRLLLERGYIDKIISHLPQTEEILRLSPLLKEFARSRT